MAGYLSDAPDPGTVETDDRCQSCSAGEGEDCRPDCRCAPCLRQQDRFWFAFAAAERHHVAGWWIACQRQQGHFPSHLIAEAARKIAEAA